MGGWEIGSSAAAYMETNQKGEKKSPWKSRGGRLRFERPSFVGRVPSRKKSESNQKKKARKKLPEGKEADDDREGAASSSKGEKNPPLTKDAGQASQEDGRKNAGAFALGEKALFLWSQKERGGGEK